jgi:GTP cyclohydrolase I
MDDLHRQICPTETSADAEALEAVKTLIRYAGDDPSRPGLRETPRRVLKAFDEWFAGYTANPAGILSRTFENEGGYQDMVVVRKIDVISHCEHHLAPIIGKASIAYIPRDRVVGLSKLARLVEAYANRLQTQETLTAQIARAIESHLRPLGTAVQITALHQCMTTRGVKHPDTATVTQSFHGSFETDADLRGRFFNSLQDQM